MDGDLRAEETQTNSKRTIYGTGSAAPVPRVRDKFSSDWCGTRPSLDGESWRQEQPTVMADSEYIDGREAS